MGRNSGRPFWQRVRVSEEPRSNSILYRLPILSGFDRVVGKSYAEPKGQLIAESAFEVPNDSKEAVSIASLFLDRIDAGVLDRQIARNRIDVGGGAIVFVGMGIDGQVPTIDGSPIGNEGSDKFLVRHFLSQHDLEGIVAKRKDSRYGDELAPWIKIKNPNYSQARDRHELFERA